MDRQQELKKYISKERLGIEIGPWFSPIAPKREGYQCLSLDIFDFQTLKQRAHIDPYIPEDKIANIEFVDLIGSSVEIEKIAAKNQLLQKVDYILSSHNFEHLPNPIRFLQGCDKVLKPDGILSMAIPDLRTCFDYFRPITQLADWLEAYFTLRDKPTFTQLFSQESLRCDYQRNAENVITFFLTEDPAHINPQKTLENAFNQWKMNLAQQNHTYQDAHCSTFTPASFELLLGDLQFLKLTQLQLLEISETNGCEFYVHLQRKAEGISTLNTDEFYNRRKMLLHRLNDERAHNSVATFQIRTELKEAYDKIALQQKELERMHLESQKDNVFIQHQIETINNNQNRIQTLQNQLKTMLSSRSWRLTSSLRYISHMLCRKRSKTPSDTRHIDIV